MGEIAVRIKARVINEKLRQACKDSGLTMTQIAEKSKVGLNVLYQAQRLDFSEGKPKTWRARAVRIAAALGIDPGEVVPEELIGEACVIPDLLGHVPPSRLLEMKDALEQRMTLPSPVEECEGPQYSNGLPIRKAIEELPSLLRRVIDLRFYEDRTLEECGNELGLTRERVRRLEDSAIRRLRKMTPETVTHNAMKRKYRGAYGDERRLDEVLRARAVER